MYMYMHIGQRVYKSNELPILYIIMYNLLFPLISLLFSPLPSSLSLHFLRSSPSSPLLSSSVLFCPLLPSLVLASPRFSLLFFSTPLLSFSILSSPLCSFSPLSFSFPSRLYPVSPSLSSSLLSLSLFLNRIFACNRSTATPTRCRNHNQSYSI